MSGVDILMVALSSWKQNRRYNQVLRPQESTMQQSAKTNRSPSTARDSLQLNAVIES